MRIKFYKNPEINPKKKKKRFYIQLNLSWIIPLTICATNIDYYI